MGSLDIVPQYSVQMNGEMVSWYLVCLTRTADVNRGTSNERNTERCSPKKKKAKKKSPEIFRVRKPGLLVSATVRLLLRLILLPIHPLILVVCLSRPLKRRLLHLPVEHFVAHGYKYAETLSSEPLVFEVCCYSRFAHPRGSRRLGSSSRT